MMLWINDLLLKAWAKWGKLLEVAIRIGFGTDVPEKHTREVLQSVKAPVKSSSKKTSRRKKS